MHALSSDEILRAWELSAAVRPAERAVAILFAGGGELQELRALPIGLRDARLLELHASTFGPVVELFLSCPSCGEQLELALEVSRLTEGPSVMAASYVLPIGEREVEIRLLDTRDLVHVAELGDVAQAADALLASAIVAVRPDGPLDEAERAAVAERIAEIDPRADLVLDATCPACAHVWQAPFDPAAFVCTEIDVAARRLFQQVAILARAFGWVERDVLALTPARRRAYIELVQAPAESAS
jgi:hypothetical protein